MRVFINGKKKLTVILIVIPILIAIGIRIVFYLSWISSAFKYYSFVKGLDMQTLLNWGVSSNHMASKNNLYVYLISLIAKLTESNIFTINAVIILQLSLGVGTVVLTVFTAWLICESKIVSVVSGILIASYAPLLMYEGFILKSTLCTFLTTALLFTSLLFYQKVRYRGLSILCAGAFASFLLYANFASLCFIVLLYFWQIFIIFKTKCNVKFLVIYPTVVLMVLMMFSFASGFGFFPVLDNVSDKRWISYVINTGSQREITTLNESIQTLDKSVYNKNTDIYPYLKKTFSLLLSVEIPDNINYYFVREGLSPLKYMISPFLLYVIATPGILFFLGSCHDKKILLLFTICGFSLALPLIIFVPLSRYTIIYSPLLCIVSAWLVKGVIQNINQKSFKPILCITFLLTLSFWMQTSLGATPFYRASDFIAFAKALECQNPRDQRICYAYEEAYNRGTESIPITLAYADSLMKHNCFSKALEILEELHRVNPTDNIVTLQLSSALLGCRRIYDAGIVLNMLEKAGLSNNTLFLYNKAEYSFQNRNYQEALKLYQKLKLIDIPAMQNVITQKVLFINSVLKN